MERLPLALSAARSGLGSPVLRRSVIAFICVAAFCIRLFPVMRWTAMIHEHDPWFNFRATEYLSVHGYAAFRAWQDDRVWYPLGRFVGGTVYPGLMLTAWKAHEALRAVGLPVELKHVCIFLGPAFTPLAVLSMYDLTKTAVGSSSTGLLAAALLAVVPSYVSRSTAGAFDNEAVAIPAVVLTCALWARAVKSGHAAWAAAAAGAYFYLALCWGGYVFASNVVPLHVAALLVAGRFSTRLHVAYSVFYTLGIALVSQVPIVGFSVVTRAEAAASHAAFVALQAAALYHWVQGRVNAGLARKLAAGAASIVAVGAAVGLVVLQATGRMQWLGRSLSVLNPLRSKALSPLVASVSEHQPAPWPAFFFDLHALVPLAGAGLAFVLESPSDASLFLVAYGTVAWYFAAAMVRLMLLLAPVACALAAVSVSEVCSSLVVYGGLDAAQGSGEAGRRSVQTQLWRVPLAEEPRTQDAEAKPVFVGREQSRATMLHRPTAPDMSSVLLTGFVGLGMAALLSTFFAHSLYAAREAYSSTGVVLAAPPLVPNSTSREVLDDFREAYAWLRANAGAGATVAAWWDYGYQLSGMANVTTIVDNNTWNGTHIARVGLALVSPEEDAYSLLLELGATHFMVVCGAKSGVRNDDIGKLVWPIRLASAEFPSAARESDFLSRDGRVHVDADGTPPVLNSLAYKLCYYRFGGVRTVPGKPPGYDVARRVEAGHTGFDLTYFEEAYSTAHWLVRIYRLRDRAEVAAAGLVLRKERQGRPALYRPVPYWTASGYRDRRTAGSGNGSAFGSGKDEEDAVLEQAAALGLRFVGCYRDEAAFAGDRVYNRGAVGSRLAAARSHAVASRKPFLAVARLSGTDGHAYALSAPKFAPNVQRVSCGPACGDAPLLTCGCAEAWCGPAILPLEGQTSPRR